MSNDYDKNEYNIEELGMLFTSTVVQNIVSTTLITPDHTYEYDHDMWNAITHSWNSYHVEIKKVGINRYSITATMIQEN